MIKAKLREYGFEINLIQSHGSAIESDTYLQIVKDGKEINLSYAAIFALKEQIIELAQKAKGLYTDKKYRQKLTEHGYTQRFLSETMQQLIFAEEYEKANDIKETLAKLTA